MKLYSGFALAILSCVTLTSCWPKTAKENATPSKEGTHENIIYLDKVLTRAAAPFPDASTTFAHYLQAGNTVVDFFATWCNPCTTMSRTIDTVAAQFPRITFLKVDVDKFPELSGDIKSLPTLIFYKDGTKVKRVSGAQDKQNLTALLQHTY
jgi:thioredoxin